MVYCNEEKARKDIFYYCECLVAKGIYNDIRKCIDDVLERIKLLDKLQGD